MAVCGELVGGDERKLVDLYRKLSAPDQATLLAFAEFLGRRIISEGVEDSTRPSEQPLDPLDIPRPNNERVVAAVKRLSRTYPMLNKNKMLGETSTLVTAHIMQGREAAAVIDDLESLFRREYALLVAVKGSS